MPEPHTGIYDRHAGANKKNGFSEYEHGLISAPAQVGRKRRLYYYRRPSVRPPLIPRMIRAVGGARTRGLNRRDIIWDKRRARYLWG